MIKFMIKDYEVKEARYRVLVIHDSGLAIELGIGLKDSVPEIVRAITEASVALEANTVNMFYSVGKTLEQAKSAGKEKGIIIEGKSQRQETPETVRDNSEPVQTNAYLSEEPMRRVSENDEDTERGPSTSNGSPEETA